AGLAGLAAVAGLATLAATTALAVAAVAGVEVGAACCARAVIGTASATLRTQTGVAVLVLSGLRNVNGETPLEAHGPGPRHAAPVEGVPCCRHATAGPRGQSLDRGKTSTRTPRTKWARGGCSGRQRPAAAISVSSSAVTAADWIG